MPITAARLLPYKRRIFIETGTYDGDGIKAAIGAGFEEIWSIELVQARYEACKAKFAAYSNVHILQGDSGSTIANVLQSIKEPVTFWLDAHGEPGYDDPVIGELRAISATGIKNHILLLDDIWESDPASQERIKLRERIREINPNYKISFIDGQQEGHSPTSKTIMVAEPVE